MSWISMIVSLSLVAGTSPSVDEPSPKADDPMAEAKSLRDQEHWSEAGAKFREALEKAPEGPEAPEARFWAGFCLEKEGEHEPAIEILLPFEGALAGDTWADDALLQLGLAYQGRGDKERAVGIWDRQVEKYPDSVWRAEVMLKRVELLFADGKDYPACLAACERVVAEFPDRASTTEARYAGAYCLNVLRRFAEADAWTGKHFDPESPLEEAWRRVLAAQRDLLGGKATQALASVGSLDMDFPDLDQGGRQDLKLRTTFMLRYNGRADRARQLLLDELNRSAGRPEDEVASLLDELDEIIGAEHRGDFLGALASLHERASTPLVVRVAARERHAEILRATEKSEEAAILLRRSISDDPVEYARVRASLLLADILADDMEDRAGGASVLDQILPKVGRRDLAHQIRTAVEKYRGAESP